MYHPKLRSATRPSCVDHSGVRWRRQAGRQTEISINIGKRWTKEHRSQALGRSRDDGGRRNTSNVDRSNFDSTSAKESTIRITGPSNRSDLLQEGLGGQPRRQLRDHTGK